MDHHALHDVVPHLLCHCLLVEWVELELLDGVLGDVHDAPAELKHTPQCLILLDVIQETELENDEILAELDELVSDCDVKGFVKSLKLPADEALEAGLKLDLLNEPVE